MSSILAVIGAAIKNQPASGGDPGSIPRSG